MKQRGAGPFRDSTQPRQRRKRRTFQCGRPGGADCWCCRPPHAPARPFSGRWQATIRFRAILSPDDAFHSPDGAFLSSEIAFLSPDYAVLSPEIAFVSSDDALVAPELTLISPAEALISRVRLLVRSRHALVPSARGLGGARWAPLASRRPRVRRRQGRRRAWAQPDAFGGDRAIPAAHASFARRQGLGPSPPPHAP